MAFCVCVVASKSQTLQPTWLVSQLLVNGNVWLDFTKIVGNLELTSTSKGLNSMYIKYLVIKL